MKAIHNLKPIYDKNSKILILGSMPSVISRNNNFYYANKNNRFWKIMELLFLIKFDNNNDKYSFLINNHIALWDVIHSCDIIGSSDSSIKNIEYNDIYSIINKSKISCIFCIGKKSYELFLKNFNVSINVIYLPSTSSANASYNLEKLVKEYQIIKEYL